MQSDTDINNNISHGGHPLRRVPAKVLQKYKTFFEVYLRSLTRVRLHSPATIPTESPRTPCCSTWRAPIPSPKDYPSKDTAATKSNPGSSREAWPERKEGRKHRARKEAGRAADIDIDISRGVTFFRRETGMFSLFSDSWVPNTAVASLAVAYARYL